MNIRLLGVVVVVASLSLMAAACTDPQVAKVRHLERGNALSADGKHREAVLEYRQAIKLDTKYGEARWGLAKAYAATDRLQEAEKEYVRAADLLPARTDVQVAAAYVYLKVSQFESARKHA